MLRRTVSHTLKLDLVRRVAGGAIRLAPRGRSTPAPHRTRAHVVITTARRGRATPPPPTSVTALER